LEDRFNCYIQGGQPKGSNNIYKGCTDKTLPTESEEIYIKSELYFANKSKSWNGSGVGFIKTDFNENKSTLGRMYLITQEQFVEVVKQETNNNSDLNIDFEKAKKSGSIIFRKKSWYGNLLYLGEQNGNPIFTFTNERNLNDKINAPNKEYLSMIISGIKETYNLSDLEIKEYLEEIEGIKGNPIEKELGKLIKKE
jgi:hypothetical protein